MSRFYWGILLLLWACTAVVGQETNHGLRTNVAPAWAEQSPVDVGGAAKPTEASQGQGFLLFAREFNGSTSETYARVVKEITSEAGVQAGANLSFSFDPSYQELTFHHVRIQRGSQWMDRLDVSKFRVIQPERNLYQQIYNGTQSALLFLDDVRVGDRIDYAYTIRGSNPVLQGKFSDTFLAQLAVPVRRLRVRVLWPSSRWLGWKRHGESPEPSVMERGGVREYLWDMKNIAAARNEDRVPSWYPAYPWVQLSEYQTWDEIAEWGAGLFATRNLNAPEIAREVARLRRATAEETVRAALDFTQNEVRYLGIEFGPNSYRPTDAITVLSRRYGDCKEKAVLLCSLLKGLGYDATPVLVGTGIRQTMPDMLPAPGNFDHVIVRVVVAGREYWVDPTAAYQRGPLEQRYLPQYGYGLPLKRGGTNLVKIPEPVANPTETRTIETFVVGVQKAPTRLKVATSYIGTEAQRIRALLADSQSAELAKSYLNDYARYYPGIHEAVPMAIHDATNLDQVDVTLEYLITNFWTISSNRQEYRCEFYPQAINYWLTKPETTERTMPLDMAYPRKRMVSTRVELPVVFQLSNLTNRIAGPGGELRVTRTWTGRAVSMNYEYTALADSLPASRTEEHIKSLHEMEQALGYALRWRNQEATGDWSQLNWPIFALAVVYGVAIFPATYLLIRFLDRRRERIPPVLPHYGEERLSGLGGWLILVGLGRVATPFLILVTLYNNSSAFALWKWHLLTTPGAESYRAAWAPCLIFELLGQITLLALCVFNLMMFFGKKRLFPWWFIATIVTSAVVLVVDEAFMQTFLREFNQSTPDANIKALVRLLFGSCIWIPYMLFSRRVRLTFIR